MSNEKKNHKRQSSEQKLTFFFTFTIDPTQRKFDKFPIYAITMFLHYKFPVVNCFANTNKTFQLSNSFFTIDSMLKAVLLVVCLFLAGTMADVYGHNPRCSNNRLNTPSRNTVTQNRYANMKNNIMTININSLTMKIRMVRETCQKSDLTRPIKIFF
jgi:hypothetical protein